MPQRLRYSCVAVCPITLKGVRRGQLATSNYFAMLWSPTTILIKHKLGNILIKLTPLISPVTVVLKIITDSKCPRPQMAVDSISGM